MSFYTPAAQRRVQPLKQLRLPVAIITSVWLTHSATEEPYSHADKHWTKVIKFDTQCQFKGIFNSAHPYGWKVWFNNAEFYKREASGKVNSDEVPQGLLSFSFSYSPHHPLWEINPSQTWESEKGTVYVLRGMTICGWRSNKGALLQWPHSDKDLWCVKNRVGWAPAPLLELWLLMHQTLPPCPALCQRYISPPIGPFQQIRCFENDFQGAVGSHSDDIKWKEQKRKKNYSGW